MTCEKKKKVFRAPQKINQNRYSQRRLTIASAVTRRSRQYDLTTPSRSTGVSSIRTSPFKAATASSQSVVPTRKCLLLNRSGEGTEAASSSNRFVQFVYWDASCSSKLTWRVRSKSSPQTFFIPRVFKIIIAFSHLQHFQPPYTQRWRERLLSVHWLWVDD